MKEKEKKNQCNSSENRQLLDLKLMIHVCLYKSSYRAE